MVRGIFLEADIVGDGSKLTLVSSKQADAAKIQHTRGFEALSSNLQFFVCQTAEGHTKLEELVRSEHSSTRHHTTVETSKIHDSIIAHVTAESSNTASHIMQHTKEVSVETSTNAERDQLLRSLKYTGMNERRNQVSDTHGVDFQKIFTSEDTATTLVKWDNFPAWLESDDRFYWISGKPGSGKSTLVHFLVSSSETRDALNRWKPGVVVFSHYLWKPGSEMQKNIKGMLSSLIHQALTHERNIVDQALSKFRQLVLKDSITDWSVRELKECCSFVMDTFSSPLCIFIDGLDEVSDNDRAFELLDTIDNLRSHLRLKICVSSRPEARYLRRLENHPHLKVQDLTYDDMRSFVDETLLPHYRRSQISAKLQQRLARELIRKAEGVFLWLRLACASVIRGIQDDNSEQELLMRLDKLPSDLFKIYADMWTRLNGDEEIYRRDAARYFNLAILTRSQRRFHESSLYQLDFSVTLFTLLLATGKIQKLSADEVVQRGSKASVSKASGLQKACIKMREDVQLRCCGLLQITPWRRPQWDGSSDEDEPIINDASGQVVGGEKKWEAVAASRVTFMHRTAYDFLVDTEDGRGILAYDKSSTEQGIIHFVEGNLAETSLSKWYASHLSMALHLLSCAEGTNVHVQNQMEELLRVMERMCCLGYIRWNGSLPPPHLFALAARYVTFHRFIVSELGKKANPAPLATHLLHSMWQHAYFPARSNHGESLVWYVEKLLSLGACPQTKWIYQLWPRGSGTIDRGDADIGSIHAFHSAFSAFLQYAYQDVCEVRTADENRYKKKYERLLPLISAFFKFQPSLTDRVYMAYTLAIDRCGNLLVATRQKFDDSQHAILVLDANLAFLLHILTEQLGRESPIPSSCTNSSAEKLTMPSARLVYLQRNGGSKLVGYSVKSPDAEVPQQLLSRLRPHISRPLWDPPEPLSVQFLYDVLELTEDPSQCRKLPSDVSIASQLAKDDIGMCSFKAALRDPAKYRMWV